MSWREVPIRISTYEIETLQRRLADVVERRSSAELRLVVLEAEAEAEILFADRDAEAGWYRAGFLAATRTRRAALHRLSASPPQIAGMPAARHGPTLPQPSPAPAPARRDSCRIGSSLLAKRLAWTMRGRVDAYRAGRAFAGDALQLGQHLPGALQHLGRHAGERATWMP